MSDDFSLSQTSPHRRLVGLGLGPALLELTLLLPAPAGLSPDAWTTAGVAFLMISWWVSETVPIPVTALLGILDTGAATAAPGGRRQTAGADDPGSGPGQGWAQRLKRVFAIDIESCPKCDGKVRVIACIEDPRLIRKILDRVQRREARIDRHAGKASCSQARKPPCRFRRR